MKKFLSTLKGKVATAGVALMSAPALFAGAAPVVPTEKLVADYALFDYVFAGIVAVAFIFMIARRVKSFIS